MFPKPVKVALSINFGLGMISQGKERPAPGVNRRGDSCPLGLEAQWSAVSSVTSGSLIPVQWAIFCAVDSYKVAIPPHRGAG